MKILMLGNSFTYYHDMDVLLSKLTGWEVERVTRGGAYLYQALDQNDEHHANFMNALCKQQWDYVVLQEQSNAPATRPELFHTSVHTLCELIREHGAKPVLYATWAYRDSTEKLASVSMTYDEMDEALCAAYHKAADDNNALVADVGKAFTAVRNTVTPYEADDFHPSEAGSILAAHVIAQTIAKDAEGHV